MSDHPAPVATNRVEWPTVILLVAWYVAIVAVVGWHAVIPWWASVPALALLGGLHFSLQHEAIHGHPTVWPRVNTALVGVPLALWCPYPLYRDSHLAHHASDLTMPGIDPESYYVSASDWDRAGPLRRTALRLNHTLAGRLLLGPWLVLASAGRDAGGALRTARGRRIWGVHMALAGLTVGLAVGVAGLPWWEYLFGLVWGGTAVTLLRSFAEHRAVTGSRSAVIVSNRFVALIFLNNNLHHTHHTRPDVPWYRLPELHLRLGSDDAARAGAGWYRGYGEIARRYLVRPFDTLIHPQDTDEAALT